MASKGEGKRESILITVPNINKIKNFNVNPTTIDYIKNYYISAALNDIKKIQS